MSPSVAELAQLTYVQVDTTTQAHVATVTLNRPELHNAFNEVFIDELCRVFTALGEQPDIRVVVLQAVGKSFCAGADLNWMKKMIDYNLDENVEDARGLARMLKAVRTCPKPVIAKVQGAAYGGGVGLISACDMAVCLDSCSFGLTEVKLGLLPAVISPFVLEKIGPGHASRYFLTAEMFSAQEAQRIGLVSSVVADDAAVEAQVATWVKALTSNAPEAVSVCKRMIFQVYNAMWEPAEEVTCRLIAERRVSSEGQEGLTAFIDKRKPRWAAG